jgi:hypothetical protein
MELLEVVVETASREVEEVLHQLQVLELTLAEMVAQV